MSGTDSRPGRSAFYLATDPDYDPEACPVKFRLTYEGPLHASSNGNGRASHKHEIRKAFHPQLKRLWAVEPNLIRWEYTENQVRPEAKKFAVGGKVPGWGDLASSFGRCGYQFVPLVSERYSLFCGLEILFLRDGSPGSIIKSGDIDNRLKTLFDALRMPSSQDELGGHNTPGEGEDPFFVLLEDDKLLNHVSVETDILLNPSPSAQQQWVANDCRLVITVSIRPAAVTLNNIHLI